jgi:hypothetical protein
MEPPPIRYRLTPFSRACRPHPVGWGKIALQSPANWLYLGRQMGEQ